VRRDPTVQRRVRRDAGARTASRRARSARRGFGGPLRALLALGLSGSLATAGCTSVHNVLGTRDSACFRVIPEARGAVGPAAKFAGVRAVSADFLLREARHRRVKAPATLEAAVHKPTCLVAFTGRFQTASVQLPWVPRPGPYRDAIVVLLQRTGRVIATVLLPRLSLRFRHSFAFVP